MADEALEIHSTLAGEEILIYDDAAFAELAGFEPDSHSFKLSLQMPRSRLAILKVLYRHGKIVDKSGFAMGHLADRVREFDALSFNPTAVLTTPMMQQCVERVTNGRRTMSVQLMALPKSWLKLVEGSLAQEVEPAALEIDVYQSPALEETTDRRLSETPAQTELSLASAVATSMLGQVIELLTTNGRDMLVAKNTKLTEELTQTRQRLGEQTGYVERLRRDLRQAQDQVIAANHERDGLRARALAAEANLAKVMSPEAGKLLEAELHKEVDKLMRQRPGTTHDVAI
jgi:hypothetical protein